MPCKVCQADDEKHNLADRPEFYTISKSNRIQEQRDKHGKDLLQPYEDGDGTPNQDFVEAYPDKREDYFDEKDLQKL